MTLSDTRAPGTVGMSVLEVARLKLKTRQTLAASGDPTSEAESDLGDEDSLSFDSGALGSDDFETPAPLITTKQNQCETLPQHTSCNPSATREEATMAPKMQRAVRAGHTSSVEHADSDRKSACVLNAPGSTQTAEESFLEPSSVSEPTLEGTPLLTADTVSVPLELESNSPERELYPLDGALTPAEKPNTTFAGPLEHGQDKSSQKLCSSRKPMGATVPDAETQAEAMKFDAGKPLDEVTVHDVEKQTEASWTDGGTPGNKTATLLREPLSSKTSPTSPGFTLAQKGDPENPDSREPSATTESLSRPPPRNSLRESHATMSATVGDSEEDEDDLESVSISSPESAQHVSSASHSTPLGQPPLTLQLPEDQAPSATQLYRPSLGLGERQRVTVASPKPAETPGLADRGEKASPALVPHTNLMAGSGLQAPPSVLSTASGRAHVAAALESEAVGLQQAADRAARAAAGVTQALISDTQHLLRLFGIPFIVSPSEAEAQCAEVCRCRLTGVTV